MPTQLPLATTGLLPMEQPQTGLLGTNFMDPRTQMALSVAASLLESGGPSLTPTSLGQSLGRATRAGLDSYEQGRQQAIQTALLKRQMLRQDKQDALADRRVDLMEQRLQQGVDDPSSVREWEYFQGLTPEQQQQYLAMKRSQQIANIGGVPHINTPDGWKPVSTLAEEATGKETLAAAQARGTANAKTDAETRSSLASLETREEQIQRIFNDPDFEGAVGPIDQLTGRIGEAMGTDAGVLGGEIERLSNKLVQEAAASWKGAISEKELELFMRSVPRRGNSAATWRSWYQNEYLPLKRKAEAKLNPASEGWAIEAVE